MLLSLVTGKGYGLGADGATTTIGYGRKTVVRLVVSSWWSRRWLVGRWRYRWFQVKDPCGCTRRRVTHRRLTVCRTHLREVLLGAFFLRESEGNSDA